MSTTLLAVMAASALASSGAVETRSAQALPAARTALVAQGASAKDACFRPVGKVSIKNAKCASHAGSTVIVPPPSTLIPNIIITGISAGVGSYVGYQVAKSS